MSAGPSGPLSWLAGQVSANSHASIEAFENPQFVPMPFAELPAWVQRRLTPLQRELVALGFRALVAYKRPSARVNWSSILVSPDGLVLAHLWVARRQGIFLWLTLLSGWRAFLRNLFASARYSLVCLFEGERRFVTSPVEILANGTVPGEREYVTTPRGMSLADACRFHDAGARAFAVRGGHGPVAVTTEQEFFEQERRLCAQIAARLRARRAAMGLD
jgi:hypothetical protein